MLNPNYNTVLATVALGTGDSTKTLVAAPAAGNAIFIIAIHWDITTAAAQAVTVGKTGGAESELALKFAASAAGNGSRHFNKYFEMPKATALIALPASAGPGIHFMVEYFIAPGTI